MKHKKTFFYSFSLFILLSAIVLVGYIAYLQANYYRIEDNKSLLVQNQQTTVLSDTGTYKLATFNIGFGAYDHEFSFFMDKGKMHDSSKVQGKYGKAVSAEVVQNNLNYGLEKLAAYDLDFCFLQEVDTTATRSFYINEKQIVQTYFTDYANVYASNFHSQYLFFPLHDPHGSVEAGMMSLSRYKINSAQRRQYPVDESFFTKFFDLDRCFALTRIEITNGRFLILINVHLSAYDEGGRIRKQQFDLLCSIMKTEYEAGNYVIVGGDFNHALCGTIASFRSQQQVPEWVAVFEDSVLTQNFRLVQANNIPEVATCRSTDIPYRKGVNYTTVVDGFIVSDNVTAEAVNLDFDFMYSDHNPVLLEFSLK